MEVVDEVAENDSVSPFEMASSLIRQLREAYMKLEAQKFAYEDNLQWEGIENHFHQMESVLKKKLEDLKVKEEEVNKKESEIHRVIAEREAVVAVKERGMLDRLQELKDAAVGAIVEARENHKAGVAVIAEPYVSITDGNDNKVSSSLDDENAGENTEDLGVKEKHYSDLIRSCEVMDANGLLNFIMHNQKDLSAVCSELSVALSSATEPARLVLDLLEGLFPSANNNTKQGVSVNDALNKGLRQSCWVIVEALKAGTRVDSFLTHEIKGQAKAIADKWMPKLAVVEGNDAANGNENSLEIEGFLRLLATFRIGSEFNEDELCKLVLAVAHRHRQATELCLSLDLTEKMPGIIEVLINSGKLSDAVHLIEAFQLSDTYPPVPLLKEYLKAVRRNTQGKGTRGNTNSQFENNKQELTALEAVVKCIKDYKLQADYPLYQLEVRIAQLMGSNVRDPKRIRGEKSYTQAPQQPKKVARNNNGGYRVNHTPSFSTRQQAQAPYLTERYPHTTATSYGYPVSTQSTYPSLDTQERYARPTANTYSYPGASTYSYPGASQGSYGAPLAGDQKPHYYVLDDATRTTSVSYGSAAPSYLSHTGSGAHTLHSHQPYM